MISSPQLYLRDTVAVGERLKVPKVVDIARYSLDGRGKEPFYLSLRVERQRQVRTCV